MRRHTIFFFIKILLAIMLLGALAGRWVWDRFTPHSPAQKQVSQLVAPYRFNLFQYEVRAIAGEGAEMAARPGMRLSAAEQRALVRHFLLLSREASQLEHQIEQCYADPAEADPIHASAPLQKKLESVQQLEDKMRPMAENILQKQVGQTIREMRLTTAGALWPPLAFNFSSMPNYLVVSPRDHIELVAGVNLHPQLSVAQKVTIEDDVARALDVSTLVEGLGGLGVWPTMVSEDADISWIASTVAHEWLHTYMAFRPLGWHMFDSPQMDTINETVATIVGNEIGAEVAWRYYGVPKPAPEPLFPPQTTLPPPDPGKFDFRLEMRRTRLKVDDLLKAGKIEEAEAYMEARRQIFVEHGYIIRKLNQAYFAFHGTYATSSASTDPIGPKLRELRSLTPDLATFVHEVQGIRRPGDLDVLLEKWRQ